MTREEALNKLLGGLTIDGVINLIDDIYNDFESRTCESCKYHYSTGECSELFIDVIGEYDADTILMHTSDDFSCNKWEKKND